MASVGADPGIKIFRSSTSCRSADLKKTKPRSPTVISRFVRKSVWDELVQQRKVKKDFSTQDITWQENDTHRLSLGKEITTTNKHLYWLARQKRAADKLKYVWYAGTRVRCRKMIYLPEYLEAFCWPCGLRQLINHNLGILTFFYSGVKSCVLWLIYYYFLFILRGLSIIFSSILPHSSV